MITKDEQEVLEWARDYHTAQAECDRRPWDRDPRKIGLNDDELYIHQRASNHERLAWTAAFMLAVQPPLVQ